MDARIADELAIIAAHNRREGHPVPVHVLLKGWQSHSAQGFRRLKRRGLVKLVRTRDWGHCVKITPAGAFWLLDMPKPSWDPAYVLPDVCPRCVDARWWKQNDVWEVSIGQAHGNAYLHTIRVP